jgi:hypothetical protein
VDLIEDALASPGALIVRTGGRPDVLLASETLPDKANASD